jgi:deazaflavin-dependent oxidoreductase (nitroreductase family)
MNTGQTQKRAPLLWRLLRRMAPFVRRNYRSRPEMGNKILFLTTTGRKSSLPRMTPLQYEVVNGDIYLGSARGIQADWVRNILANPNVEVELKGEKFQAQAEVTLESERIIQFLEIRLERHPLMIKMMLLIHGVPPWVGRNRLVKLANDLALVVIHRSKQ